MADTIDVGRSRVLSRSSLLPLVCFLSPFVTSAVPRLTWLFLPLLALSFAMAAVRRGSDWRQLIKPNAALWALLLVVAYVLLGATWADNPPATLVKGGLLFTATVITFAAIAALAEGDAEQLRRAAFAFAIGAFLSGLFMLSELLTDGAITRGYADVLAWLRPGATIMHMKFVDGRVAKMDVSQLNRSIAMVMFNLWSGLLVLQTLEDRTRRVAASLLFALAIAVPVVISKHQSSQVALLGSVPAFFLARLWPKTVFRALAVIWCLGFVLVMPLSFLSYDAGLHLATWVPHSFRARIIIWEYTSERTLKHPWLGIGARSTRAERTPEALSEKPKGFAYPRNTAAHAHNMFLQSWYELGLVGVILIAVAGAIIALRMSLLPFEVQPFAAATFGTFLGIASFAWGMWQTWLICAVGLMVVYLRLAGEACREVPGTSRHSRREFRPTDASAPLPLAN